CVSCRACPPHVLCRMSQVRGMREENGGAELAGIVRVIAWSRVPVECKAIAGAGRGGAQKRFHFGLDQLGVLGGPAGQVEPKTVVEVILLDERQDQGAPPPARQAVPA